MGRKKIIVTEADKKEAQERYKKNRKIKVKSTQTRENLKNPHKKIRIDDGDGFNIVIETLNRACLNTLIINVIVTYLFQNVKAVFLRLKGELIQDITKWLIDDGNYDDKNKIWIADIPENNDVYTGKYRTTTYQLYLRRITEPLVSWDETVVGVIPLVNIIKNRIQETCSGNNIVICKKERLTNSGENSGSNASKPQSS